MKSMEENESLLFDFYRKAQIPTSETDTVEKNGTWWELTCK